jgi:hypothetical protein
MDPGKWRVQVDRQKRDTKNVTVDLGEAVKRPLAGRCRSAATRRDARPK